MGDSGVSFWHRAGFNRLGIWLSVRTVFLQCCSAIRSGHIRLRFLTRDGVTPCLVQTHDAIGDKACRNAERDSSEIEVT